MENRIAQIEKAIADNARLQIKGMYLGQEGTYSGFSKDTRGRVVASFTHSALLPNGRQRVTRGIYIATATAIKFY